MFDDAMSDEEVAEKLMRDRVKKLPWLVLCTFVLVAGLLIVSVFDNDLPVIALISLGIVCVCQMNFIKTGGFQFTARPMIGDYIEGVCWPLMALALLIDIGALFAAIAIIGTGVIANGIHFWKLEKRALEQ